MEIILECEKCHRELTNFLPSGNVMGNTPVFRVIVSSHECREMPNKANTADEKKLDDFKVGRKIWQPTSFRG